MFISFTYLELAVYSLNNFLKKLHQQVTLFALVLPQNVLKKLFQLLLF